MKSFCVSILLSCNALDDWVDFKSQFGKVYETDVEEQHRASVFAENVAFMQAENAKGHSYTLGVNKFSDLTNAEFVELYVSARLSDAVEEELPFLGDHQFDKDVELPSSVDWSQRGAVTGIKDQGQCGSCWAFSGVGALEGAYQIASGRLVSLSEQQMVDCDGFPNRGCSGGQMATVYKHAKANGACLETSYSYEMRQGNCRETGCALGISKNGVKGYKKVGTALTTASMKGLMSAVVQQPVSIAIEADKPIFQHYSGGVITGDCGGRTDHGVLAVGYGTTGGVDYWKVKNSWGRNWGQSGYVYLKRDNVLSGECGILSSPTYPVMGASDVVV